MKLYPRTKIFYGDPKNSGIFADRLFNEWIEENGSIRILHFNYQTFSDGSDAIAVVYTEGGES